MVVACGCEQLLVIRKCGGPYIHFKVVGQIQVVGQISGMEVSVDSIIKKAFCSRNYDEKLDIAKAEKPTPKLNILSSKLGCLKKCLMLARVIALSFQALPHICFKNACIRQLIL